MNRVLCSSQIAALQLALVFDLVPTTMALLLSARSPCLLRGALASKRFIHLTPVQATAEGGDAKLPVQGKSVLAQRLCQTHKELTTKQAAEIIDTLCDDIMLTVAEGYTVTLPGFGSFKKRHR